MLGFMPEYLHAEKRADTAADDGGQKERLFGHAPFMTLCLPLIQAHEQEDVYKRQW